MEVIVQFLTTFIDSEGTVRWVVIALAAATVTVFGMGISFLLQSLSDPVRRRLSESSLSPRSHRSRPSR